MPFSYFDMGKDRFWMSNGNVRSCRELEKTQDKEKLKAFIDRNAVAKTTQKEMVFHHPDAQTFVATQINPNFEPIESDDEDEKADEDKK